MFTLYNLLLFTHVLLFVYWLGADVGVFYGVRYVLRSDLSLETRKTVMALVHWIDALPRICLVMMVPVGSSLAILSGLIELSEAWRAPLLAGIWLVGLAWLAIVMRLYSGAKGWLTQVDWTIRVVVMLGFLVAGASSLAGLGPVMPGINWLALKFIFYAGAIGCGITLRLLGKPFGAAYAQIMAGHSTPELEARLANAMQTSRKVVVLLWVFVAATAFLGITKSI